MHASGRCVRGRAVSGSDKWRSTCPLSASCVDTSRRFRHPESRHGAKVLATRRRRVYVGPHRSSAVAAPRVSLDDTRRGAVPGGAGCVSCLKMTCVSTQTHRPSATRPSRFSRSRTVSRVAVPEPYQRQNRREVQATVVSSSFISMRNAASCGHSLNVGGARPMRHDCGACRSSWRS